MEIKDGRYIAMILFVYGEQDRDWLAHAYRDGDGPWRLEWRFRYYAKGKEGDPFSDEDDKSGYQADMPAGTPEDKVCLALREMAKLLLSSGYNDKLDVIEPKTDNARKVIELMSARPWCHFKAMPIEGTA